MIIVAIAALASILVAALAARGADLPPVGSDGTRAAAGTIESRIAERLEKRLPPGTRISRVEIGCAIAPGTKLVRVAPGIARLSSRSFTVEIETAGKLRGCSAVIEAQRRLLLARHDLEAGRRVSAEDFRIGWYDAFAAAPGALSSYAAQDSMEAATRLTRGRPVYPSQLRRPLALRPGDPVTVLVRNGSVTLRTKLESRSEATIGQSAIVVNPATGTMLNVRVTGLDRGELILK